MVNTEHHNQILEAYIPDNRSGSPTEANAMDQEIESNVDGSGVPCTSESRETVRSSRVSEEGLEDEIDESGDSDGESHMYDTPFDGGAMSQQQQSSTCRQTVAAEGTCYNSIQQQFQNNQLESLSQDHEESQSTRETVAGTENTTEEANPDVTVTINFDDGSHFFHDIPGFHDPELKEDDADNNGLHVIVPPNIYSSQILSTVTHDQDEEPAEGTYEHNGTETTGITGMETEPVVLSLSQGM